MSLTAANSLPLQVERTKKREPNMAIGKFFGGDLKKNNAQTSGNSELTASLKGKVPPPDVKSKSPKRKTIGQRMVERAGY